jgi:hypothetical protein
MRPDSPPGLLFSYPEAPMVIVEDFTRYSEGMTLALEGAVRRCPRCGRNGVERQRHDGTSRVLHVQTSEIFGDGMRTEPQDICLFPRAGNA